MTDISLNDAVVIDESVVFRELEGELVILNLETGIYFGLDEVGTRIWTLMREHQTLDRVLDVLLNEYDAPRETLQADLIALAEKLASHKLAEIKRIGEPPPV